MLGLLVIILFKSLLHVFCSLVFSAHNSSEFLQIISCHLKVVVANVCLFSFVTVISFFMSVSASAVQNCWQKLWLPSSAPSPFLVWAKTIPDLGHSPQLCYRISFYKKNCIILLVGIFSTAKKTL